MEKYCRESYTEMLVCSSLCLDHFSLFFCVYLSVCPQVEGVTETLKNMLLVMDAQKIYDIIGDVSVPCFVSVSLFSYKYLPLYMCSQFETSRGTLSIDANRLLTCVRNCCRKKQRLLTRPSLQRHQVMLQWSKKATRLYTTAMIQERAISKKLPTVNSRSMSSCLRHQSSCLMAAKSDRGSWSRMQTWPSSRRARRHLGPSRHPCRRRRGANDLTSKRIMSSTCGETTRHRIL